MKTVKLFQTTLFLLLCAAIPVFAQQKPTPTTKPAQPAGRMRVPSALPEDDRGLQGRSASDARGPGGACRRLHPCLSVRQPIASPPHSSRMRPSALRAGKEFGASLTASSAFGTRGHAHVSPLLRTGASGTEHCNYHKSGFSGRRGRERGTPHHALKSGACWREGTAIGKSDEGNTEDLQRIRRR